MEFFNPFNADKWRDLVNDFDRKREAFFDNLSALQQTKGATPELERERNKLIASAAPIQKNIDRLMNSLQGVRGFLKGIGRTTGLGDDLTLNDLGFVPIPLVIGLGAAAVIVSSITSWLKQAQAFAQRNEYAKTLADAGATPSEIIQATSQKPPGQSSAKIFGFDVRWLLALGGIVIIAPYALRMLEGKR